MRATISLGIRSRGGSTAGGGGEAGEAGEAGLRAATDPVTGVPASTGGESIV